MSEKPILFSGEMVRAILDGRKSQTRRVVKFPESMLDDGALPEICHGKSGEGFSFYVAGTGNKILKCPYGKPGDRLWVRETFQELFDPLNKSSNRWESTTPPTGHHVIYRATDGKPNESPWRPSIHMPRWASRLTLEITGVRVERLNEISHRDALAEGVEYDVSKEDGAPLQRFKSLWESINGKGSWDLNPWVWVVTFQRIKTEGRE